MTLVELKSAVFARWEAAFDEIAILKEKELRVHSKRFAPMHRHDLRDYNSGKLKAGGKMGYIPLIDEKTYYEYGYDGNNRPVFVRYHDHFTEDKKGRAGYYQFKPGLVEYIEYDLHTRVPCSVQQVFLKKSKKIASAFLSVYRKANTIEYDGSNKAAVVSHIVDNPESIICTVTNYEYEGSRIKHSKNLTRSRTEDDSEYTEDYTYHENGMLKMIRMNLADNISAPRYYRSYPKIPFTQLSKSLSEKTASAIIRELRSWPFEGPIAILEMQYKDVLDYWPSLQVITQKEKEKIIEEGESPFVPPDELLSEDPIFFSALGLTNLICEFNDRINEGENYDAGTRMLRKTAALLNKSRLEGQIPISDDFVAYPIDAGMEVDDLETILLRSGANRKLVTKWKKAGWLEEPLIDEEEEDDEE